MKKILGISLCALFAVSAANAEIASTEWVNQKVSGLEVGALEDRVEANESDITTLTGRVDTNEQAINGHTTAIAENVTKIGENATKIGTNTTNIATNTQAIAGMNFTGTTGQYVTTVSQADGKVSATGADFADNVATGGDIAPTSTAVVTYVRDNAVQTVVPGTANGTIKVDGTDVAVTGLGSAAYTDASTLATNESLGALARKNTVATGDIDANAVTSAQIANNTITNADISDTAKIAMGKIDFTGEQTGAIDSGIDSAKVTQIGTNTGSINTLNNSMTTLEERVELDEGKITANTNAIALMNAESTTGQYVKYVKQENGKVIAEGTSFDTSVSDTSNNAPTSKAVAGHVATYVTNNAVQTVESGTANGTIKVDGTDVAVTGLAALAYKGTVGTDDIDANAVTSAKIADRTIVNADIKDDAAIASSKIAFDTTQNTVFGSGITSNLVADIGTTRDNLNAMLGEGTGYADCKNSTYGCTLVVMNGRFSWEAIKREVSAQ